MTNEARCGQAAVNINLDKTGGLTETLVMADAPQARYVDLDGPLLLAHDRDGGLRYDVSLVYPPEAALWG